MTDERLEELRKRFTGPPGFYEAATMTEGTKMVLELIAEIDRLRKTATSGKAECERAKRELSQ